MKKSVIVIGPDHHNTLGVIRSLGRKEIYPYVIFITSKNTSIKKSKYISNYCILDSIDLLLDKLFSILDVCSDKPLLIACSDQISSYIDLNHDKLSNSFICPGSEIQGKITNLMDKEKMAQCALEAGLNIPNSLVIDGDYSDFELSKLNYPCIVKPLVSIKGCKSEIKIISTKQELQKYLSHFAHPSFQVQDYIEKSFEYQLIGCVLSDRVVIPGRTVILHQPKNTNTAFLRYEKLDGTEPIPACLSFLRSTAYKGLFSIELLRGVDGKDYFMEINFRNDGNAISVTDFGINLPYILYLDSCNENVDGELSNATKSLYCIPDYEILYLWYDNTITFRDLLHSFRIATSHMDYDKNDPSPTKGYFSFVNLFLLLVVKKFIKKIIRKK